MTKDKKTVKTSTNAVPVKSKRPKSKGVFKRGLIQEVTVPVYAKGQGIVGYTREKRIAKLVRIGGKKMMMHCKLPEKQEHK